MLKLVQTCGACPEQYDVYQGDLLVGYMRLRHGAFRTDCLGETVYMADPRGDGSFEGDERDYYLEQGCRAILNRLGGVRERLYEIVESVGG